VVGNYRKTYTFVGPVIPQRRVITGKHDLPVNLQRWQIIGKNLNLIKKLLK